MRKIVWLLILNVVVGVIAYSQYKNYASPSYTEMSLDEALAHYVEHFDDDYLSQPEKESLKSLIDDSKTVELEHGGSRLSGSIPDEYDLYLNASLFDADSLSPSAATENLAKNPDNFMLILTLIHENQHRKDLQTMDSPLLRRPEKDLVKAHTLGTMLEYFGYKKEFEIWKQWNDRHNFELPECNVHNNGGWTRVNSNELTPEQYGFGVAMYMFWKSFLPAAEQHLPDSDEAKESFKNQVRINVINELQALESNTLKYGASFLDNILYCPDEGFSSRINN